MADFNIAIVWMVSTCLLISKSSNFFTNPLRIVLTALITFCISVKFMFHRSFLVLLQGQGIHLSHRFLLILAYGQPGRLILLFDRFSFYLVFLTITVPARLADIRRSVCTPKFQRTLYISFLRMDSGLCIYHLFLWSTNQFLLVSVCLFGWLVCWLVDWLGFLVKSERQQVSYILRGSCKYFN